MPQQTLETDMANSTATTTVQGGNGFATLLTILFIALKLTHVIAWSWWWVLSPLWIGFAVTFAVLVLIGIGVVIVSIFS